MLLSVFMVRNWAVFYRHTAGLSGTILKDLEYLVVIVIDAGGWEVVGLEARKARVSHSSWLRRFLE